MTAPADGVDELLAQYRARRTEADELRRSLAAVSETATSPRREVEATVGAQGELTALEFPSGAHRRLPPRELAELIVATTAEARSRVMARATELLAPTMPPGVDLRGLLDGSVGTDAVLPADPVAADDVADYLAHGRPGRS